LEVSEVFKVGLAILTSLGGATLILFAFSSWLGKVWAGRILETEKNKLASELEAIKVNNQNFINAIGVSNTLYVESQKAFTSERVCAIKSLWSELISLKKNKPTAITFLDLLSFKEYKQIHKNHNLNHFDNELSIEKLGELMRSDVEELRPFIDEKSYSYFWSYRALIGRVSYYVKNIRDKGQPEKRWQEDAGVIEVIKPIFSKSELSQFQSEKWSTQVLFGYIETAFSQHLRNLASGVEMSKESLDHSMSLHKAAENLRKIENEEMS
jgi:hypothetical protein